MSDVVTARDRRWMNEEKQDNFPNSPSPPGKSFISEPAQKEEHSNILENVRMSLKRSGLFSRLFSDLLFFPKRTDFFGARRRNSKEINLLPRQNKASGEFFSFPKFSWRSVPKLLEFLGVALLFLSIFPLLASVSKNLQARASVLGAATSAYEDLQQAQAAFFISDFDAVGENLKDAYEGFSYALAKIQDVAVIASALPPVRQAEEILVAAQEATLGLQHLNEALRALTNLRLGPGGFAASGAAIDQDYFRASIRNLENAGSYLVSAHTRLSRIDLASLPPELQAEISQVEGLLDGLQEHMGEFTGLTDLMTALVSPQERTYLLLFQNFRELRATGGFIGTYGVMRTQAGRINSLKIETVYNPDGQLKENIAPPGPLQHFLTKQWALRDSNWFFNFPDSARKAAEFLLLETGIGADGVIAFTPRIFERLLAITGPVALPSYGVALDEQNFVDVVQYQTSEAYDQKLNQPKQFLADFAPLLLRRMESLEVTSWISVIEKSLVSLQEKDLLFYSFDSDLQQKFSNFHWTGEVSAWDGNYLAVVASNVGAGKTDQNIKQHIVLSTELVGGQYKNELTILRKHEPGAEKEFPINVSYLRVFAPEGSQIGEVSGFDPLLYYPAEVAGAMVDPDLAAIDKTGVLYPSMNAQATREHGKTVFAGWVVLAPGQEREIKIFYTSPAAEASMTDPGVYKLLIQKQPGSPATELDTAFILPAGTAALRHSDEIQADEGRLVFSSDLKSDQSWAAVFGVPR
ncbi:MAG: DUF4012 domain-containing protein [Candidatus Doudnabacteria bacterium]|nr:DUF4012 domain-containing protein [Candidatus Doudnabacteria bacterium]